MQKNRFCTEDMTHYLNKEKVIMKKRICSIIALVTALTMFAGCSDDTSSTDSTPETSSLTDSVADTTASSAEDDRENSSDTDPGAENSGSDESEAADTELPVITEATCVEEDGNIILSIPAEGYAMRAIYVFDENGNFVDTIAEVIPGELTTLEEIIAAGEDIGDPSEFTYENGRYTASMGVMDMEGTAMKSCSPPLRKQWP